MSPDRWHKVKRICEEVQGRAAGEREELLARACAGDDGLRKEVESYLACGSGNSFEAPAIEIAAGAMAKDEARHRDQNLIGQTIRHYRIVEKIGEGGMGEVYLAEDASLRRKVALKFLPAALSGDPERLARFEREARLLAALNHPNITSIYDIDKREGSDFIVMEYVAGKTLNDIIPRKGLKPGAALKYAVQIADAVSKAHQAGIIHRDLKPGNVMVDRDGHIKVLDFGLAKLTEVEPLQEDAATGTAATTEEGTIMGTVAYMSPEQAEGRKVDARSDIFSFGSVLYEMVTGRKAFEGPSKISTLSAILHQEPKLPSAISPAIPSELEKLISRCLRKDPDRRIHSMVDVKLALEDLRDALESGAVFETRSPPVLFRRKFVFQAAGVAAALLILAGVAYWRFNAGREGIQPPNLRRLTWDADFTTDPALSPDGKLLVYASNRGNKSNLDLWVQQIEGTLLLSIAEATTGNGMSAEPEE
jgi:eukaryotic-like serine/threonine-protein kinase